MSIGSNTKYGIHPGSLPVLLTDIGRHVPPFHCYVMGKFAAVTPKFSIVKTEATLAVMQEGLRQTGPLSTKLSRYASDPS